MTEEHLTGSVMAIIFFTELERIVILECLSASEKENAQWLVL